MLNSPVAVVTNKDQFAQYEPLNRVGEVAKFQLEGSDLQWNGGVFEVVVLDCGFDTETGFAVLCDLKVQFPGVPVLFVSAVDSAAVIRQAFRCGARDFFSTPFDQEELLAMVVNLLALKLESKERRQSLPKIAPSFDPIGTENMLSVDVPKSIPNRLRRVLAYIDRYCCNELYLEQLAEISCLSKFHFCRLFRQHIGMSPMQFVAIRRITLAKLLLAENGVSVTDVAFKVGFSTTSDFIRKFKKITGLTPAVFRNRKFRQTNSPQNS